MAENGQCISLTQAAGKIGSGATAIVYKVEHPATGRDVAVKVLRKEQALVELFESEREILSNAVEIWKKGEFFLWNLPATQDLITVLEVTGGTKEKLACVSPEARPFPVLFSEYTCAAIEGEKYPALVMEWLDTSKDAVLVQFDQERKGIENAVQGRLESIRSFEKKLLYLGCQLGQVMLLMKTMGMYNPDMKWDDIFWLDAKQGKRLVLLDWNGLKAFGSPDGSLPWEMVEKGIQRTIASFLYRLATGKILSSSFEGTLEQQMEEGLTKLSYSYSRPFQDWLIEGLRGTTSLEKWLLTVWVMWLFAERRLTSLQLIKLVDAGKSDIAPPRWLAWARAYVWGESREGLEREAWNALWAAWIEASSDKALQDFAVEIWNKMTSDYHHEVWENIGDVVDKLGNDSLQDLLPEVIAFRENWQKLESNPEWLSVIGHRILHTLDNLGKKIEQEGEAQIADVMAQKVRDFILEEVATYQARVEFLQNALAWLDRKEKTDKKKLVILWDTLATLGEKGESFGVRRKICRKWCEDVLAQAAGKEWGPGTYQWLSRQWNVPYKDIERITSWCCHEESLQKFLEWYKNFKNASPKSCEERLKATVQGIDILETEAAAHFD